MKTVDCPFCNGKAELCMDRSKRFFRREEFEVYEYYYKCNVCGKEFTTTDIDKFNTEQVYNLYREQNSIPFPEQLKSLREHYGLSAAKMSELLGFGPNQYRLYESGEIPTGGNATVLGLIVKPESFRNILINNRSSLTSKKIDELLSRIDEKPDNNSGEWVKQSNFPSDIIPNRYTGFALPRFIKFANMVLYFISDARFKVRLNKLLFYADFVNFKYTGYSISGCRYAAIDMGPVPDKYSYTFSLLESEKYLTTDLVKTERGEFEKFVPMMKFEKEIFNEAELLTLKDVLGCFKKLSTQQLIKISHNEAAWKDNSEEKSIIDYSEYAPQIIAL